MTESQIDPREAKLTELERELRYTGNRETALMIMFLAAVIVLMFQNYRCG